MTHNSIVYIVAVDLSDNLEWGLGLHVSLLLTVTNDITEA